MPRDVEEEVGTLANVFLYNLDDLQRVVATNLDRRRADLPTAETLITNEVERYWQWLAGLEAVPVLTQFRARMNAAREAELAIALRQMGDLPPAQREVVERLAWSLMNKFMHEPSVRLRAAAANGRGLGIVDAMRYLFALESATSNSDGVVPTRHEAHAPEDHHARGEE